MSTGAAEPAYPPPTGFRLATPGNWFDVDLDPASRNTSIAELVDRRIAASPQIADRRNDLVRLLRKAAREAAERDVIFLSMMAEEVEGAGMAASVNLVAIPGFPSADDPGAVSAIAQQLRERSGDAYSRDVRTVQLDVGAAVRVAGAQEAALPGVAQTLVAFMVQYFVPVPGTHTLAVLTLATPTLALTEGFTDLFDAIASTFRFEWGGALIPPQPEHSAAGASTQQRATPATPGS